MIREHTSPSKYPSVSLQHTATTSGLAVNPFVISNFDPPSVKLSRATPNSPKQSPLHACCSMHLLLQMQIWIKPVSTHSPSSPAPLNLYCASSLSQLLLSFPPAPFSSKRPHAFHASTPYRPRLYISIALTCHQNSSQKDHIRTAHPMVTTTYLHPSLLPAALLLTFT